MAESVKPPHIEGYPVSDTTYTNRKCRCEGCTEAHRISHVHWRRNLNEKQRRKRNQVLSRRKAARLAEQHRLADYPNNGKPWSEQDRAVALDRSLTVRQAAERLGRSFYAVKQYRSDNRD